MKKNGFIATSLIYSFFLIFITLFLTIIAEGLQQKLWLNEIEKGIKDEINSSMGIKDFEVGDIINIDDNHSDTSFYSDWVIANVDYTNKKLILYSFDFSGNIACMTPESTTDLKYSDFNDIDSGYMNHTYFNKIIYTFDKSSGTNYKLDDGNYIETSIDNVVDSSKSCKKTCTAGEEGCSCSSESGVEVCNKSCSSGEEGCVCTINSSLIQDDTPFENESNYIVSESYLTNKNNQNRKRVIVNIGDTKLISDVKSGDGIIRLSC